MPSDLPTSDDGKVTLVVTIEEDLLRRIEASLKTDLPAEEDSTG